MIIEEDTKCFSDKASDLFSDLISGSYKTVESTKKLGAKFGNFLKDYESKTKTKINTDK